MSDKIGTMEVSELIEQPDGSAIVTFDYDPQVGADLVLAGLRQVVRDDLLGISDWIPTNQPEGEPESFSVSVEFPPEVEQYFFCFAVKQGLEAGISQYEKEKQLTFDFYQ